MHLAVLAILVPDLLTAMRVAVVAEADAVLVVESTLLLTMVERAAAGVQWQWHSHSVVAPLYCHYRCPMAPLLRAVGDRSCCWYVEQTRD